MSELPTGTVTFLFTDIEGSTRLLTEAGSTYGAMLEEHRRLIREAVERGGGTIFGTEGDAVFATFARASDAIEASADLQRALLEHPWPDGRQLSVRAGIHSGEVTLTEGGYVGLTIHEVARVSAAGHGGQVLVSGATRELAADALRPSLELRDLGEFRLKDMRHPVRLYQLTGDGLPEEFPPPRTMGSRADNLPLQLTTFVGREELAEGKRLLAGTRLLTLTGPGGTGKTRLALQLASEMSSDFANGVVFVPLDAVRDPDLIPSEIVSGLGLATGTGKASQPMTRVLDHLRDRSILVVLDNFEQVAEGAAVIADLLRGATGVKVLATSRIPLRITGEQEFQIPPLALPQEGVPSVDQALRSEAVLLFVQRATAARPDFRFTDENAAAVVDIVRRLDGLPLAIELAAARLRVLSVEVLRERLDQRLAVLTGGPRDLPARQQTLRDTIEWSYELLEPPDRELFQRFGVFANAACLVEAEPVCGPQGDLGEEVIDGLVSLSEKSLLRPVPHPVEDPRFAMLATIREYAIDRLAGSSQAEEIQYRHADAYLALVERSAPGLLGPHGRFLLDRLDQDHDNLRLALDWALERGKVGFALRYLIGAWRFWQIRGHLEEGWDRAQRVLALPNVRAEPAALRARALGAAGSLAYWRGLVPRAFELYREALDLARATGDSSIIAEAAYNFGFVPSPAVSFGPELSTLGRPFFNEAASLYRQLGDREGLASVTGALGESYMRAGDWETGRPLLEESLTLYRETENQFGIGWSLMAMSQFAFQTGGPADALPPLVEAMQVFAGTRDLTGMVGCLMGLALGARAVGAMEQHWRLAGATETLANRYWTPIDNTELEQYGFEPLIRPVEDTEARRAWDAGAAMTVDEAVAYALEIAPDLLAAAQPP